MCYYVRFLNQVKLNLNQNSIVSSEIKGLLTVLSSHSKLKSLNLSNCQLKSCEINQVAIHFKENEIFTVC